LPAGVYASLWREGDGTVAIHLFNATGVRNVPGETITIDAPRPPFPPLEKDIVFTVPEGRRAVAVSPDFAGERDLAARPNADGTLTVVLPSNLLRAYVLIRVGDGRKSQGPLS